MDLMYINRDIQSQYQLTFFVPCLNEQGNIGPTLDNIKMVCAKFAITYEILVFDDGSIDNSVLEIEDFKRKNPEVFLKLIKNKKRRGLARNYSDGAYIGLGEYYLLVNGDNAEPVESIRQIISQIGKADIIIPIFGSNDTRTFKRRLISKVFTFLVNKVSGNNIGYYNGPALHRRFNVMRWHADTDGFAYQAEIITRLLQEGATYKEVVITNQDRQFGKSSALNFKNLLAVGHSLLQIILRRVRWEMFYK